MCGQVVHTCHTRHLVAFCTNVCSPRKVYEKANAPDQPGQGVPALGLGRTSPRMDNAARTRMNTGDLQLAERAHC